MTVGGPGADLGGAYADEGAEPGDEHREGRHRPLQVQPAPEPPPLLVDDPAARSGSTRNGQINVCDDDDVCAMILPRDRGHPGLP